MTNARLDTDLQTYILLHDPTPLDDGGFLPGARFSAYEINYMLRFLPGTLPDGVILEHHGARYQVQEKFDHHDRLCKQHLVPLA